MVDVHLQDTIYHLLQERPELRRYLDEMIRWQERKPFANSYDGWEWSDVHTAPGIINMLIAAGVVDMRSGSRQYKHYGLHSLADTKAAIASLNLPAPVEGEVDVSDLFTFVVGLDRVKQLLKLAVKAEAPVHCLLMGPPGTAKTMLLSDIGRLPGAEFYGSYVTKSGLQEMLVAQKPRFLIIDEIDKMPDRDMSPLLLLMENGMVTRLMHGVNERITMGTKVFAGGNDLKRISAPIQSRFAKFEVPAYSPAQFVEVARTVLMQREGLGEQMALHVATEVVRHSTDIRDAVRVARISGNDPRLVLDVVACLWPNRSDGKVVNIPQRG